MDSPVMDISVDAQLSTAASDFIRSKIGFDFKPTVAMILGSGLGSVADEIEVLKAFSYDELPGFFVSTVPGHEGRLVLGHLSGVPVVCMHGRVHLYEGADPGYIKNHIYTLKALGCRNLVLTNASGSLRKEVGPGEITLITDHINFQIPNPLVGVNNPEFGPRFVPMDQAYPEGLRDIAKRHAQNLGVNLHEGVYMGVMGPMYETAAEIRAYRALGADLVGMSTASEVVVATQCQLPVLGCAVLTNYATGIADEVLSHLDVIGRAGEAANHLIDLIKSALVDIEQWTL